MVDGDIDDLMIDEMGAILFQIQLLQKEQAAAVALCILTH
jgi:hypothetical protein